MVKMTARYNLAVFFYPILLLNFTIFVKIYYNIHKGCEQHDKVAKT